ncbi:MAG: zinc-binding dehydrogenase [Verrucomicrobiales bacterium]|nr:zinc-binding dehydrogenase [Verrucomicrobiales bacterium]
MFARMNEFLAKHQIRPVVDETFAFAEAEKAYECLENAGHFGKVAIEF